MNTDLFRVKIEKDKYIKWTRDIQDLIEKCNNSINITGKELEKMVGKINHTILVIPTGGFFLEILNYRLSIANKWVPQQLIKCQK